MKKSLFKFQNYQFDFDKNDRKVLKTFTAQALKQLEGDNKNYQAVRIFTSIKEKLSSAEDTVKLTKEEKTILVLQLKENIKFLKSQSEKANFIKKWFYKTMFKQYDRILISHFND